jgi:hypothetical protein
MGKFVTPLGQVIEGRPVTHRSGECFIRDPATGKYWKLSDCQIVTDQSPPKAPVPTLDTYQGIPPWDFDS